MDNPFSAVFGEKPRQLVERREQTNKIISSFEEDNPAKRAFMLTGIRGVGKTVMLTELSAHFRQKADWIVLNLSVDQELMESAVVMLDSLPALHALFLKAEIKIGAFGSDITLKNPQPFSNADATLRRMLATLSKQQKKVLFIIDEVINNDAVKRFTSCFQIYMREEYPVFLIMAGLFNNINNLSKQKTLTFLLRAPKIRLDMLNIFAVANKYANIFGISQEKAMEMSRLTNGYPFAFQYLGELAWDNNGFVKEKIIPEFDAGLFDIYEKIWTELSTKDREVLSVISNNLTKIQDIRMKMEMSSQMMNQYRKRLIDQGILDGSNRGVLKFVLPRFEEYVKTYGVI